MIFAKTPASMWNLDLKKSSHGKIRQKSDILLQRVISVAFCTYIYFWSKFGALSQIWEIATWIHSNLLLPFWALTKIVWVIPSVRTHNTNLKTVQLSHRGLAVERRHRKRRVLGSNPALDKMTDWFFFTICLKASTIILEMEHQLVNKGNKRWQSWAGTMYQTVSTHRHQHCGEVIESPS